MFYISKGGLTVPDPIFFEYGEKFEEDFIKFHKDDMDRGERIIDRFTDVLVTKYGHVYKREVLNLFSKTRTYIRLKYLCNALKQKQSKGTRDYKQTAQHSV